MSTKSLKVYKKIVATKPNAIASIMDTPPASIAKGSAEERLNKETSIGKHVLTLEHPLFALEYVDDELTFILEQDITNWYYGEDIFDHNNVKSISAADFVLSRYGDDSYKWVDSTARKFNFEEYNASDVNQQVMLMCYISIKYFVSKYGKIDSLDDIDRPVPLQMFVKAVTKQLNNIDVMYEYNGEVYGSSLINIYLDRGFFGDMLVGVFSVISRGKEGYVSGRMEVPLPTPSKAMKLEDIGLTPITEEHRKKLTERGRKYVAYTSNPSYCYYKGFAHRPGGWFGDVRTSINGRVMVDICAMRALKPNVSDRWYIGRPFEPNKSFNEVPENMLWRCAPVVYGFSFMTKDWVRMRIDDISDIEFSNTAFDELIVPDEFKDIFIASLTHDMPSLDSIEGKGGGKIFLLYGPPGCGKTMTAESVAEVLHKPLYYVSTGELGLSPSEMETNLSQVMDVATSWDAVVLLDEVDVFAAKRTQSDIHKNAMTAILLRLLERYDGVMFMTTNLIDNLDPAFISRATSTIGYNALTSDSKAVIWKNILKKAESLNISVDPEVYESLGELSQNNLNGREIKNHIRLAYSIAQSKKSAITMQILNSVLSLHSA